jgi:hypothetical protein
MLIDGHSAGGSPSKNYQPNGRQSRTHQHFPPFGHHRHCRRDGSPHPAPAAASAIRATVARYRGDVMACRPSIRPRSSTSSVLCRKSLQACRPGRRTVITPRHVRGPAPLDSSRRVRRLRSRILEWTIQGSTWLDYSDRNSSGEWSGRPRPSNRRKEPRRVAPAGLLYLPRPDIIEGDCQ